MKISTFRHFLLTRRTPALWLLCCSTLLSCLCAFSQSESPISIQLTNILGETLSGRIELRDDKNTIVRSYIIPDGKLKSTVPAGNFKLYIFVIENEVPYGVYIKNVTIKENKPAKLNLELLEGSAPNESLSKFDIDGDLYISRVEIEQGTDPEDSSSVPGISLYEWPEQKLNTKMGWYRGELHAQSNYGRGKESVAKLIKRAESLRLDFLSIVDPNTLDSALDKDFESKSMVLIPGLEWGNDENGVALVYAPLFLPKKPETSSDMRTYTRLLQNQGALVFAGRPCFPLSVWNWTGVPVDGIQAWCMGWDAIPPIGITQVHERNRGAKKITIERKNKQGNLETIERIRYNRSIALAANSVGLSANGQAAKFWDLEMSKGIKLAMIGGSQTANPKVPMASPVTYVYAKEQSLDGILNGILNGRTYVSSGLNGPQIDWVADIKDDGYIDTTMGGQIPIDTETRFYGRVRNAKGKKLVVLTNGVSLMSMNIPTDNWVFTLFQKPETYTVYRLRIVEEAKTGKKYSFNNVLAMTSPIYAEGVLPDDLGTGAAEWVSIKPTDYINPEDLNSIVQKLDENTPPPLVIK